MGRMKAQIGDAEPNRFLSEICASARCSAAVAAAVMAATVLLTVSAPVRGYDLQTPYTYFGQATNYYCGEGTAEMMLSVPNSTIDVNPSPPTQTTLYNQASLVQGAGFHGTLPNALVGALTFAAHSNNTWSQYINAPTLLGADQAERNIANALAATQIPVAAVVFSGAHWIAVTGVNATATPVVNQPYLINGFYVADPWTGYAAANPAPGQPLGLGYRNYISNYTYNYIFPTFSVLYNPFLSRVFTPLANVPGTIWHGNYVTVADPPAGAYAPPPADNGANESIQTITENVNTITAVSAQQAITDAALALSSSPQLSSDLLNGSTEDTMATDTTFIENSIVKNSGIGDWVVPYQDPNGTVGKNIDGFLAINNLTGGIDSAGFFTSSTEIPLSELNNYAAAPFSGALPQDDQALNAVPEPAAAALLMCAGFTTLIIRRRKSGRPRSCLTANPS